MALTVTRGEHTLRLRAIVRDWPTGTPLYGYAAMRDEEGDLMEIIFRPGDTIKRGNEVWVIKEEAGL